MEKRNNYNFKLILFLLFFSTIKYTIAEPLPLFQFLRLVKESHPISRSSALTNQQGMYEVLQARGFFDPTLSYHSETKTFKDINYYSQGYGELKIPTWPGIDIKTGLESNSGVFLNPEEKTPSNGLMNIGLQLSVFNTLFTDERRNALRQAKIISKMQGQESRKIINKLLYDAGKSYSEWFLFIKVNEIRAEAEQLAKDRFDATKQRAKAGDVASIDSLDAYSEYQKRILELSQSKYEAVVQKLKISTFLWKNDSQELTLSEKVIPEPTPLSNGSEMNYDNINNPEIEKGKLKIESLGLERRLANRNLYPDLNIGYNVLQTGSKVFPEQNAHYFENNYKAFASFYYPLFIRKSRGKLKLIENKRSIQELELASNQRTLRYELAKNLQESNFLRSGIELQKSNIVFFQKLTDAEKTRFRSGESTVFLVNARELKMIDAQLKLAELESKLLKNSVEYFYLIGGFGI